MGPNCSGAAHLERDPLTLTIGLDFTGRREDLKVFLGDEIKVMRRSLGLTQKEFAAAFRVGLGTIRHWERGDRTPEGPAQVFLRVIQKEPDAVLRVLRTLDKAG